MSMHECMCYTYEHPWYACGLEPQLRLFLTVFVCSVHDGWKKKIHKVMVPIPHAHKTPLILLGPMEFSIKFDTVKSGWSIGYT